MEKIFGRGGGQKSTASPCYSSQKLFLGGGGDKNLCGGRVFPAPSHTTALKKVVLIDPIILFTKTRLVVSNFSIIIEFFIC